MHVRPDAIHMTVTPHTTANEIERALTECGDKLRQSQKEIGATTFDTGYRIESDNISLSIVEHAAGSFIIKYNGKEITIACPQGTDYSHSATRELLHKGVTNALTRMAKRVLPPRLAMLAAKHGFTYRSCTVRNVHTRWGSCSGNRGISLSIYLMLLPDKLIDYVLLHELCHTVEMNHSDRFWALLDRCTAPAKAKALRAELKEFRNGLL